MKRIYFTLSVIILLQVNGYSQKIYLQASGGYSFGFLRSTVNSSSYSAEIKYDTAYNEVLSNEGYPFSFGSGVSVNLGFGIELTEYLNFELSAFYNPSNKIEFKTRDYYYFPVGGYFFQYTVKHNLQGNEYGFVPALKLHFNGKKISPYTRIGMIFSFSNIVYNYDGNYFTTHPSFYPFADESFIYEYERKLNIGVNAAFGIDVYVADRLISFLDAIGNFFNYVP